MAKARVRNFEIDKHIVVELLSNGKGHVQLRSDFFRYFAVEVTHVNVDSRGYIRLFVKYSCSDDFYGIKNLHLFREIKSINEDLDIQKADIVYNLENEPVGVVIKIDYEDFDNIPSPKMSEFLKLAERIEKLEGIIGRLKSD